MNPEVQRIIDQKNSEYEIMKNAKEQSERIKVLDKVGLYTKEYGTPKGQYGYSKEEIELYPLSEMKDGVLRRYRKVYPEITDEDFEALKNTAELMPDTKDTTEAVLDNSTQTGLAKFMIILSLVLYLSFFIIGIVMGNNSIESYLTSRSHFSFGTALLYWIIGVFAGTIMLGFSHIVDHLYKQTLLLKRIQEK